MSRFFHFVGRVFDFLITLTGRLLFLLLIIGVVALLMSGPEPLQVPEDGLVVINPRGAIVEQGGLVDPGTLLLGAAEVNTTAVRDIVEALQRAATDDRITGVLLDLSEMGSASAAILEAIGAALDEFKASSGKTLLAYGDYYSQPQYLLASYADTVYLHPMGQLILPGYGGSQLFFADLLDRLGVNVHIFRVGTHKAAVEPFMLNSMSEESRSNNQQLADELWQHYLDQVSLNRGLSESAVRDYAENYPAHLLSAGGNTAQVAMRHGLVDELVSKPLFRNQVQNLTGDAEGPAQTIDFQQYLRRTSRPQLPSPSEIGVIVAQGTIDVGEQPRGMIGADTINQLIREARNNDRIKALVLRIDSPGGSALASELIREELMQLQAAGKPLVVSMGGTAASGGYWIAANADEIWASPVTITGSIGIFGVIPTFENSLSEWGVHTDGVSTTPMTRADVFSGLTEPVAAVFQATVE
ncbi:MAG: signal peptide peptidase SppA, partial [Pseudomonas sp.]